MLKYRVTTLALIGFGVASIGTSFAQAPLDSPQARQIEHGYQYSPNPPDSPQARQIEHGYQYSPQEPSGSPKGLGGEQYSPGLGTTSGAAAGRDNKGN